MAVRCARMADDPRSNSGVSRRAMVRRAAAMMGGGAAMLSATPAAAQGPGTTRTPARRTFRAYVALGREASVQTLTLLPIGPRQVVVRTEAAQICYSTTRQGLGAVNVAQAVIPCSRRRRHRDRGGRERRARGGGPARDRRGAGAVRHLLQLPAGARGSLPARQRRRQSERRDRRDARRHEGRGFPRRLFRADGRVRELLRPGRHHRVVGGAVGAGRRRHGGTGRDDDQGQGRGRIGCRRARLRAARV